MFVSLANFNELVKDVRSLFRSVVRTVWPLWTWDCQSSQYVRNVPPQTWHEIFKSSPAVFQSPHWGLWSRRCSAISRPPKALEVPFVQQEQDQLRKNYPDITELLAVHFAVSYDPGQKCIYRSTRCGMGEVWSAMVPEPRGNWRNQDSHHVNFPTTCSMHTICQVFLKALGLVANPHNSPMMEVLKV